MKPDWPAERSEPPSSKTTREPNQTSPTQCQGTFRQCLDLRPLGKAKQALEQDGILIVEDVIDLEHIHILRERVLADLDKYVNRPDASFNWNRGNIQQAPPPFPPFLFRDILAIDFVIQITKSILGAGMMNAFYSGNTAMPSESRQPVHADLGQLWPAQQNPHPAYGLVVNIGLVGMSPKNGSTEVWPGTHLDPSVVFEDGDIEVSPEHLEARRAVSLPLQADVAQGSAVIRDIRLWHAGMPNRTLEPRPVLAMIHYVNWWPTDKFVLHASAESLLTHPDLRQHATYKDGAIDYVGGAAGHENERL